MRFHVDAWDPGYGTSSVPTPDGRRPTVPDVDLAVERDLADWKPVEPTPLPPPAAVLFVDGVRRIDARVWVDHPDDTAPPGSGAAPSVVGAVASQALCASYAAGVVCCTGNRAHLLAADVRRTLFSTAQPAADVVTWAGTYTARQVDHDDTDSLNAALQHALSEVEVAVTAAARNTLDPRDRENDLLVVDGPLRGRGHLPRALGFVKTHRAEYLPPALHTLVGQLDSGHRSPVFRLAARNRERYSWYLRLPGVRAAFWAGIVRVECSADLTADEAIALADLSQPTLCRYASAEYKDARAPQNLYPIAGLERELRRRLGDPRLLYRALRAVAHPGG